MMQCLSTLLKALPGGVPWCCYRSLLEVSHKDHATAISAARLVQAIVTGVSAADAQGSAWLQQQQLLPCNWSSHDI